MAGEGVMGATSPQCRSAHRMYRGIPSRKPIRHFLRRKQSGRGVQTRDPLMLRSCEGSQIRILTMYVLGGGDVILGTRQLTSFAGGYPQIGDKCACKFGNLREGVRKLALDLRKGVRKFQPHTTWS